MVGLVYKHDDTQGRSKVHDVAQVSPTDINLPVVRASICANGKVDDVTIMPGTVRSP